jgi:hypothetical protein
MSMTRRLWLKAFVSALALVFPLAAFQWSNQKKDKQRDQTIRNVKGIVQLPDDNPAQGAVVKIKNLKNLEVRSFITQSDGRYHFQNLSTSVDYELQAEHKDLTSAKRTLSIYDSRLDIIVNLKLEPKKKESNE